MRLLTNKTLVRISLLLTLVLLLGACGGDSKLKWYVVSPWTEQGQINLKFLILGTWNTLSMSFLALLISVVVGLLIAIPGIASNKPLRFTNVFYVEIVRSIPLLPLILWVYYGPVSYTHLRAHETDSLSRMPSSA